MTRMMYRDCNGPVCLLVRDLRHPCLLIVSTERECAPPASVIISERIPPPLVRRAFKGTGEVWAAEGWVLVWGDSYPDMRCSDVG